MSSPYSVVCADKDMFVMLYRIFCFHQTQGRPAVSVCLVWKPGPQKKTTTKRSDWEVGASAGSPPKTRPLSVTINALEQALFRQPYVCLCMALYWHSVFPGLSWLI